MHELKNKTPTVLVTGAFGYIGSHVCKVLHDRGYLVDGLDIKVSDNKIGDYCQNVFISDILALKRIRQYDAVVHLAGLIDVAESVDHPDEYYRTNTSGTSHICRQYPDAHIIFASTAGAFDPQSPYAQSKIAAEQIIRQLVPDNHTILRFFNVAGSDGKNKQIGKATHLIRIAAECAAGKRDYMHVYGQNYDTKDGTCVRDYIHVVDLANAIAVAVREGPKNTPYECIGSGTGYTVWEVIDAMRRVTGKNFSAFPTERRSGDPAILTIDNQFDGLTITHTLEDMCESAYKVIINE